jgi:ABC-type uncharacterized transport system fused permease/ATPase subunit
MVAPDRWREGGFQCAGLTHADQRITEDVEKFCFAVADLYSYTFKPLLDVLLFTRSLAKSMGYRAQIALYSYYLLSAALLRALSPPLALMTAQETGLAGAFRSAHQVDPCTFPLLCCGVYPDKTIC